MDLSRIEMWTRKALESEAARRGIRDPHLRTRTELVRLILRQHYGGPLGRGRRRVADGLHTLRQARDLLGAAVEAAAESLPDAFRRTSAGTTESPAPAPIRPERAERPRPVAVPRAAPAPDDEAPGLHSGRDADGDDTRATREQPISWGADGPMALEGFGGAEERPTPEPGRALTTSDVVPARESSRIAAGSEAAREDTESSPTTDLETAATLSLDPPRVPAEAAESARETRETLADAPVASGSKTLPPAPYPPASSEPSPASATPADADLDGATRSMDPPAMASAAHAPSGRPTGGVAGTTTTSVFEQEPIRTHSMARLLARQGHRERALAIYEELLARHTDEPTLRDEAEILRSGGDVQRIPSHLPGPTSDFPLPVTADHIACDGAIERGVGVHWTVTPEGTARAAAVLGQPGELAIRVVAISPDPERVVRSEITEHGPVAPEGSWQAQPIGPSSRCFVAIGLRANDRFVSIAHTRPL